MQLPHYTEFDNLITSTLYWYTSKTSGTLKTPWYGQDFDENKFEYVAYYVYWIFLPTSLSNIIDIYPDLTFVLHFYMDVNLYPGYEQVWLYNLFKSGEKEEVEEEYFYQTGNISILRKYNASKFPQGEYTYVNYERVVDKTLVDKNPERRNTGFQLTWYYEDGSGNKVEVEEDKKYEEEIDNKRFVTFMNLVFEAVTWHEVSFEMLWDTAKRFRLDYIHKKTRNEVFCDFWTFTDSDDYLDFFSSDLNISLTLQDQSVYYEKEQLTNGLLTVGFQLFHYIARCQDMDKGSIDMFKKYMNSFNLDSTTTMLEAAMVMNNIETKLKPGRDIWKNSSVEKLMQKMNEVFGLNIHKLEILSSTVNDLENVKNDEIKKELNTCMGKEHCKELRNIVNDQGKMLNV